MSKIDELINELCPDGVEFLLLGDICEIKTGKGITKKDSTEDGEFPIISGGKEPMGMYHSANRQANTVTISRVGANAGFVNYIDVDFYLNDKCFSVIPLEKYKNRVDSKFLYEYLKNNEQKITDMQSEGGVPTINTQKVSSIALPVPPLEVQREIVRVLDSFTLLTAELTAELTARQKQYEYYRNELLHKPDAKKVSLEELTIKVSSINWKKCSEEKKYIDLSSVSRDTHSIIDEDVTIINSENAPSRAKQVIKTGDILFGGTRPMLKRFCIVPEEYDGNVASTGYCVLRVDERKALPNYIYHCIGTTDFYAYVEANQQGASYPAIGDGVLKKYEVSLPSIEEQKKIVEILDDFENLCNDISLGLPAEIDARQKQYEYYRDKLLTFKEKE